MKTKRRRDESPQRAHPRSSKAKRRRQTNCFAKGKPPPDENLQFKLQIHALSFGSGGVLNLKNNYSLNKEHLAEIREALPRIKSLDLGFCHTLTDQDFATIVGFDLLPDTKVLEAEDDAKTLPLEKINLTCSNIGDAGVAAIVMRCRDLKHLDLSNTRITDLSLSLIAQHCKSLMTLDVSGCDVGSYGIQLIAQECNANLVGLKVNDCIRLNDAIIPYLVFYCTNLAHLSIRNTKIPARGIAALLQKRSLSELNMESLHVTDALLLRLATTQQESLRILHLSYCYDLSPEKIIEATRACRLLQEIHLYGLSLEEHHFQSLVREGLKIYSDQF